MRLASLSGSRPTTTDGCVRFANSDSENNRALKNEFTPPNGITPESCCNECNDNGFILAGVENQGSSCCMCFELLFDELSSTYQTSLLKSVITRPVSRAT